MNADLVNGITVTTAGALRNAYGNPLDGLHFKDVEYYTWRAQNVHTN